MHDLFPASLINCIRDGLQPYSKDVALLSKKIWKEGLVYCQQNRRQLSYVFAEIALSGCAEKVAPKTSAQF